MFETTKEGNNFSMATTENCTYTILEIVDTMVT